jgi:three-Cys-motif partner protein
MNNAYCRTCPDREANKSKGNCLNLPPDGFPVRCGSPWTITKHWFVEGYCDIVTRGMKKKYKDNMYFIDLYAGPGYYYKWSSGAIFEGSPMIAAKHDFKKIFLVDLNRNNIDALKHRLTDNPKEIIYYNANANDVTELINSQLPVNSLSFCFVDPENMRQLRFDTLKKLTINRKIDLLINFPYGMAFKRAVKNVSDKYRPGNALDLFFNSPKWNDIFIENNKEYSAELFIKILDLYLRQFYDIGYIPPHPDHPRNYEIIKSDRNQELYFLIYLSKHPLGHEFWSEIVKYTKGKNLEFNF